MQSLSVATIARNEERDLPGFLRNFLHLADEIVIVDDGSTDRTSEIARGHDSRVRVVEASPTTDRRFDRLRNQAIQESSGDWVLQVDVDNRVQFALAREIQAKIQLTDWDAWRYRRQQFLFQRPMRFGGPQRWNQPWLFRRGLGRFEGRVHESLRLEVPAVRVGQLRQPMVHLADEDFAERLRKHVTYCELEVARDQELGRSFGLLDTSARSAFASLKSFVVHQGFRDGRMGLLWSLWVLSSSINRYLYSYSRRIQGSRADLERAVEESFD